MIPTAEQVLKHHSGDAQLMGKLLDMLKDQGEWLELMDMFCKEYIRNNGTKTTTPEEIMDYLMTSGFSKLPQDIKDKFVDAFNLRKTALFMELSFNGSPAS